jgi:hypothetical protein
LQRRYRFLRILTKTYSWVCSFVLVGDFFAGESDLVDLWPDFLFKFCEAFYAEI